MLYVVFNPLGQTKFLIFFGQQGLICVFCFVERLPRFKLTGDHFQPAFQSIEAGGGEW